MLCDGRGSIVFEVLELSIDGIFDVGILLKRLQEDCDAVVSRVGSAAEALKLFQNQEFDVLVSDIGMAAEKMGTR